MMCKSIPPYSTGTVDFYLALRHQSISNIIAKFLKMFNGFFLTLFSVLLVGCGSQSTLSKLHLAAAEGDVTAARHLIENGADVNSNGYEEGTPLHQAIRNNQLSMVELLVENGADIDFRWNWYATPLYDAASLGHNDIVRLLLRHGANPNKALFISGLTPLMAAARAGHKETVEVLLKSGAKASTRSGSSEGNLTASSMARQGGHLDVVELLSPYERNEEAAKIKEIHAISSKWKERRDEAAMVALLNYCFDESVTKEKVQELMGKPDKVTQGELVWTYTAKPSEPDGERQSAIFGFDDNQRVMGARLQSSSGAIHQKVRQPSGAVEQKWIHNKN